MEIRTEDELCRSKIKKESRAASKEDEEPVHVFTTGEENSENNLIKKPTEGIQNNNPAPPTENSNNYLKLRNLL